MGITVEFKDFNEMVAFAKVLLAGPAAPATEPAKQEVKKAVTQEAPIEMEEAPAAEETKAYTLEEVRAALAALTRAGKQKQVKELLTSFGAANLTSVKPEDYAALMDKAGAL